MKVPEGNGILQERERERETESVKSGTNQLRHPGFDERLRRTNESGIIIPDMNS